MAQLIHDCPRCGTKKITFEVHRASNVFRDDKKLKGEVFCSCRNCGKTTVFLLATEIPMSVETFQDICSDNQQGVLSPHMEVSGFVSARDFSIGERAPEHVPEEISSIYQEGVVCESVQCFNAAGTMFRLCLDKATEQLLPAQDEDGLNAKIRRSLGLRLMWLFKTRRLDLALEDLSHCIKEDGNDGAHQGDLKAIDVEDLRDFTSALLERLFTVPERIRLAAVRRDQRRSAS